MDREGEARPITERRGAYLMPRIAPDGSRIAVVMTDENTGWRDIWIYDARTGIFSPLASGEAHDTDPLWTPDSQTIVFSSGRDGGVLNLFSVPANGSDGPIRLTNHREGVTFARFWLSGGERPELVYHHTSRSAAAPIFSAVPAQKAEDLLRTRFDQPQASISADGRFLAYVSSESGRKEVYVELFPNPVRKWRISTDGGDEPLWSPTGRELFYRSGDRMMAVPISSKPSFKSGAPLVLFQGDYARDPIEKDVQNYHVAPDGEHFVMVREPLDPDRAPEQLNVVLDWAEEVRRVVPNQ